MVTVVFYEKPGCINNTRQKALLAAAGHEVDARNLLTETWTAEWLRSFFGERPVAEWFNRSAPQVTSGAVDPERCDAAHALQLMVANPLLIRRPLMAVGEVKQVGFEEAAVRRWIGLGEVASGGEDLESCPRQP